jgi:protein-disulfide isomerase
MDTRKITTWTIVTLAIIGLFGFLVYIGGKSAVPKVLSLLTAVGPADHIRGLDTAKATLVEYSDFECPACARYAPLVHEIETLFPEDLRVVYRHFPLVQIHEKAMAAAQASEAAALQGKFWEMHDKLFAAQEEWVNASSTEETFLKYAADLGLDTNKFTSDLKSETIQKHIDGDIQSGFQNNIQGTPTFFLNGAQVTPSSAEEFKSLVEKAIKQ